MFSLTDRSRACTERCQKYFDRGVWVLSGRVSPGGCRIGKEVMRSRRLGYVIWYKNQYDTRIMILVVYNLDLIPPSCPGDSQWRVRCALWSLPTGSHIPQKPRKMAFFPDQLLPYPPVQQLPSLSMDLTNSGLECSPFAFFPVSNMPFYDPTWLVHPGWCTRQRTRPTTLHPSSRGNSACIGKCTTKLSWEQGEFTA